MGAMAEHSGNLLQRMKQKTRGLRREVFAIYLAVRHPATPWYAKAVAACVVAYALSPVDLIPDPIPIVGYLDDLVVVPLGVVLLRRLIPPEVLAECRERAEAGVQVRGGWRVAGAVIIGTLWVLTAGLLLAWGWHRFGK